MGAQTVPAAGAGTPVHIRFAGVLGKKAFACGERYSVGTEHPVTVTPGDLRFYVSGLALVDATGKAIPVTLEQDGIWQYRDVALVDLENGAGGCRNGNAATHTVLTGTVPAGAYTGVRFTVGIPLDLGHVDPTASPSPLNFTAMSWVWQSGFKFIRAELLVEGQGGEAASPQTSRTVAAGAKPPANARRMNSAGFPIHIGSDGCVSASRTEPPASECVYPNRATVTLNDFDPANDTVIFDVDRLIAGSNLVSNVPETAPGCMSSPNDPDCAPIFHALGLPFGKDAAVEQTVFHKQMP